MENITYLLGAGASANALPLILEIPGRLVTFANYLKYHPGNCNVSAYIKDIQELFEALNDHNTIDGYAKALAQNKVDKVNCNTKLKKLKSILCGLFTFEQLRKKHSVLDDETGNAPLAKKVKTTLDPRYRTFFAKILNEDKLNDRIKILSWNYDMQLEIGLESNLGYKYADLYKTCTIFPHPSHEIKNQNKYLGYHQSSQIIKLNGMANIFLREDAFYSTYLDQEEYFDDQIETVLNIHREVSRYQYYNPFLNFAWEQNEQTKKTIEFAKSIINQTRILVVIGYSFPDFNRLIDKEIFQNEQIREIYLQLPANDFDFVTDKMNASIRDISKVKLKSNLNEFFIPNQF